MTYTVTGAHSGRCYKFGVSAETAAAYAVNNGFASMGREERDALAAMKQLAVGEAWKSHEDARGIKITRTA
jgi:hypothetical protein